MLRSALATPTGSTNADIARLREALALALERCLERPGVAWQVLVSEGETRGAWDEWRVAGLLAALDADSDPAPEVTLDVLAALADELVHRRDVVPGVWEGAERQGAVDSPRWREGQRAREIVFGIERAMELLQRGDVSGLTGVAAMIEVRDPDGDRFPGLVAALSGCADGVASGDGGDALASSLTRLRACLASTPFAASIDRLHHDDPAHDDPADRAPRGS